MPARANTSTAPKFEFVTLEARPGAPAAISEPSEEIATDFPSKSPAVPTGVPFSVAVGVVIVPAHPPAGCSNTYTLPSPCCIPTVADGAPTAIVLASPLSATDVPNASSVRSVS
jgi:hypothetical protein